MTCNNNQLFVMKGDAAKRHVDSKHNWSQWSMWSPCSEECMVGESQGRSRQCLDETKTTINDVLPCVEQVLTNI